MQEVYERPNGRIGVRTVFDPKNEESKSKTQQHFKDKSDVNKIVARAFKTGVIDPKVLNTNNMMYGDFTSGFDFKEAQQKMIDAQNDFNALPAAVRKRFNGDPAALIDFIADDANYDEAVRLGLIEKKVSPPVSEPVEPVVEPTTE